MIIEGIDHLEEFRAALKDTAELATEYAVEMYGEAQRASLALGKKPRSEFPRHESADSESD